MKSRTTSGSHRVTVVVDTSLRGLDSLEAAASLAAHRKASLEALFVEDAALFQLAALPFARELDRASGAVRPMSTANLEGWLRMNLRRVRRAVDEAVAQRSVPTSVRVARGRYVDVALAAAPSVDVLFFWSVQHIARRRSSPLVAVGASGRGAICVVYDASEASRRALEIGVDLAETAHRPLHVVLVSDAGADPTTIRSSAQAALSGGVSVSFTEAASTHAALAGGEVGREDWQLVLLPQARAHDPASPAAALLEALDCPVVLVS